MRSDPGHDVPQPDPTRTPGGGTAPSVPSLSLPKGGGAITGIGEKLAANPVTGTASLSVPVFISPGRAGFSPQLALAYDSGAGNSAFGLGWSLSLPAVSRRTDKGLPRYDDAHDSDIYLLSGAEDLVPAHELRDGTWQRDEIAAVVGGVAYRVQRYRPRVEGLFARIERWSQRATGEVFWKTINKSNITSFYGRSAASRVADPGDPRRVFSWLLDETQDDKGNVMVYEYKAEDADGIDPGAPAERNRLAHGAIGAQRYLKRIRYGNQVPFARGPWHFEVVVDYGEHDRERPAVREDAPWPVRPDPFSSYRAGFEIRTYRLCRRVLMFHSFPALGDAPALVRSTDLVHHEDEVATQLAAVTQCGYIRSRDGGYDRASLPPLELGYSRATIDDEVRTLDGDSFENAPSGIDGGWYRWVDLDSEGLSGLLTEQGGAWFYKRNLGALARDAAEPAANGVPPPPPRARPRRGQLGPAEIVPTQPSFTQATGKQQQLMDIAGDGRAYVVQLAPPVPGYFERDGDHWQPFTPFRDVPSVSWSDPNLRLIDLTGDGLADVLITGDNLFVWYPGRARAGFGEPAWWRPPLDEEHGPRVVFADALESIYLADMSGDGMTDIVRIRNGEVCYWPNLGYGRFGAKVTMDRAPVLDLPDQFNPRRIRLADVDGSGTTDIVYLGRERVTLWFNRSGNSWSDPRVLSQCPPVDDLTSVSVVDLLGNGTSCLVWSSPLPRDATRPLRYIDLMSGKKPLLLESLTNNLGARTRLHYAPSTRFYLEDRAAGRPWATRLPFPVQLVERVETCDEITGTTVVTRYRYHHGYFDGPEREFRGFGLVEQWDTEQFVATTGADLPAQPGLTAGAELQQPATYTRTWFDLGLPLTGELARAYERDYYAGDPRAARLAGSALPDAALTAVEERAAWRTLKGSIVRQEIYGLDGSSASQHPYRVSQHRYALRRVQPQLDDRHAVFFGFEEESLEAHYERDPSDPRVAHKLTLAVDAHGHVLDSASVGYPRRAPACEPDHRLFEQRRLFVQYAQSTVVNVDRDLDVYRLGIPIESVAYEVTGLAPPHGELFAPDGLLRDLRTAEAIAYECEPSPGGAQKRLIARTRTLYARDDLSGPLPLGTVEALALPFESYKLAFTPGLVAQVYGDRVDARMLREDCRYLEDDEYQRSGLFPPGDGGAWWIPSGRAVYDGDAASHFFMARAFRNPFGATTAIEYDAFDLMLEVTRDPVGNTVRAANDYRVLQPWLLTDANANRSAARFDSFGMVVATAVMGKAGAGEGDTLDAPTTRIDYDLFRWMSQRRPNVVHTQARVMHGSDAAGWQESFSYSDGFGRELMTKFQAAPGPAPTRDARGALERDGGGTLVMSHQATRWVGNGRTVYNNKGNAIKRYEPFYSSTPDYEDELELVAAGVTPVLHYDALGRLIHTDYPNGTVSRSVIGVWEQQNWDVNDTVLESEWHRLRQALPDRDPERRADEATLPHARTPSVAHVDAMGRTVLNVLDNGADGAYRTRFEVDILGNLRALIDARGNRATWQQFDLAARKIFTGMLDAGERWTLLDAAGQARFTWDSRGRRLRREYDAVQRAARLFVRDAGDGEVLAQETIFGETQPDAEARNLRNEIYQQRDGAGVLTSNQFDFKGNLVSSTLRLLESYRDEVDWRAEPVLGDEEFTTAARYDALNRPIELTTPDGSVTTPIYDAANKLDRLVVRVRGASDETVFVDHIAYTAKGQREAIEYGNGVRTDYDYDPLTARLRRLRTVRRDDGAVLQDLGYTRDPMSNTTRLADRAQQTIFFDNAVVSPVMEFVYDALYRLTEARGREHPGQIGSPQPTPDDSPRTNHPLPSQGDVMQRYVERYRYDAVGNLGQMAHAASSGSWTRHYAYDAGSNRLRSTSVPGDPAAGPYSAVYDHDPHGNITRMPHLARMDWNVLDQLRRVELGGGGEAFYTYNASGMRVRKVVERRDGSRQERIYLGGCEIYRERRGDELERERQSLHVLDLEERVALVETTTVQDGAPVEAPAAVTRYQLDNEQRSSCLELDGRGRILSYEEYYPFGGTSYQAVDRGVEVSRKRYRYLGKERDSETGLSYCLARYYAPWLGRWVSCDPAGFADGTNVYAYNRNNPIRYTDPSGTEAEDEKPEQVLDVLKHLGISTDRGDPGDSSGGLFGAIGDLFSAIWSGIKTVAGAIGGAIATAASAVWTWTKGAVSAAWEWLKGAASAAWEWTKNAVSAAWNWLKGAVSAAWEWTKNAVSAAWNWTKDAVSAAWEWTKSAATAAWNWTKQAVTDAWNWTKQAVSDAWEWTKNAAAAVWDWTKRAAAVLWNGFKAVVAFTWNWILAPLIRTATNAAAGFLVGGIAGAIVGGIMGAAHGFAMAYAGSYDWGSFGGWVEFLADNTWSLPNSVVGSLFATLNLIGGNSVDDATSKDTGELYFSGQWFSPFDTTLGNVTVGTVVPTHERTHALQARLFGPLFYPLVLANYVVATVLPYWVFYHDFAAHPINSIGDYFKCGVYPHTWHEEWAYSVQGGVC